MSSSFIKFHNRPTHIVSDCDLITGNPSVVLSEALKAARTNLMYSLSDIEGGKCVLFTSAQPAEGKTTTCINIATALAQTEARVLLVDADMRRPRIHCYLKIKNAKGLANFLGGFAELDDIIQHLENANIDCITAGKLPPNPSELLSSKKMQVLIASVKENYDYIIFDSPPVNAVADTITLSRSVENAIFVCKCGQTIALELKKAISALQFTKAKILGFITISAFNRKQKKKYYTKYYYQSI